MAACSNCGAGFGIFRRRVSGLVDQEAMPRDQGLFCTAAPHPLNWILRRLLQHYCRHCGENYCSSCCSFKVPRKYFGATGASAYCGPLVMGVNRLSDRSLLPPAPSSTSCRDRDGARVRAVRQATPATR
jgi:hypothetical protein